MRAAVAKLDFGPLAERAPAPVVPLRKTQTFATNLPPAAVFPKNEAPDRRGNSRKDQGPSKVGATGFEPATTCTPSGPGRCAAVIGSRQVFRILWRSIRLTCPKIPRIHQASQKFCYHFATADRATAHRRPGRA